MEYLILLVVALGAAAFFLTGLALLYLYFRSTRATDDYYEDEPAQYGSVICPNCRAANPAGSAICFNCRAPLPGAVSYQRPAPGYPTAPPGPPPDFRPTVQTPQPSPQQAQQTAVPQRPERTIAAARNAPAPPPPPPSPHRPPDMPHAWVEGVGGAMQGQRVVLIKADTLVGRSTVCDVQVHDPKVSRRHCLIRFANGAFFLQDQQSSRGTTVNNERVLAQRLRNGDRIDLGDTTLVFRVQ